MRGLTGLLISTLLLTGNLWAGVRNYKFELGGYPKVIDSYSTKTYQGVLRLYSIKSNYGEYYILAELWRKNSVKESLLVLTGERSEIKVGKEKACSPIDFKDVAKGEAYMVYALLKRMPSALKEAFAKTKENNPWHWVLDSLYLSITARPLGKPQKITWEREGPKMYCDECDLYLQECNGHCYDNFAECNALSGEIKDPTEFARCKAHCIVTYANCRHMCNAGWQRCKENCQPRPKSH